MLESIRILSRKCFTNVGEGQGRDGEIAGHWQGPGLRLSHMHILFFLIFIYFIFGCIGSFLLCEGYFLVAASGDYSLAAVPKLLLAVASLVEHRL